jgi:hypothetical protein
LPTGKDNIMNEDQMLDARPQSFIIERPDKRKERKIDEIGEKERTEGMIETSIA